MRRPPANRAHLRFLSGRARFFRCLRLSLAVLPAQCMSIGFEPSLLLRYISFFPRVTEMSSSLIFLRSVLRLIPRISAALT